MNHFKIPVALGAVQTLSQYQQLARKLKAYLVTQNMYVKQIFYTDITQYQQTFVFFK